MRRKKSKLSRFYADGVEVHTDCVCVCAGCVRACVCECIVLGVVFLIIHLKVGKRSVCVCLCVCVCVCVCVEQECMCECVWNRVCVAVFCALFTKCSPHKMESLLHTERRRNAPLSSLGFETLTQNMGVSSTAQHCHCSAQFLWSPGSSIPLTTHPPHHPSAGDPGHGALPEAARTAHAQRRRQEVRRRDVPVALRHQPGRSVPQTRRVSVVRRVRFAKISKPTLKILPPPNW